MGDALIQTPRPFSTIQTGNVNFEVTTFGRAVDQARENSGIYLTLFLSSPSVPNTFSKPFGFEQGKVTIIVFELTHCGKREVVPLFMRVLH